MNAEMLHDALNLLPGDLITATDKLRSAPRKKKIHWLRYASMAACIALILYGGMWFVSGLFGAGASMESTKEFQNTSDSVAEAPMAQAPAEDTDCLTEMEESVIDIPAEPNEEFGESIGIYVGGSAGYAVTYGHKEGVEYPQVTVIRNRQELENYYDEYRNDYDMDSLEEGCVHWTESFFAQHDLLLVLTMENDGYDCPQVGYLNQQDDGSWELTFQGYFEVGEGIDAETPWHIYVEIEKGLIAPEDVINVIFE